MSDTKAEVLSFLEKCDEFKKCKFIMAAAKIKDLLKSIASSRELYNLFAAVTKDFNYPLVKSKCLVTIDDGMYSRDYVILPQTVGQRLAFIFCLLVEFDNETVNFNDFLRRFFPEDGSFYSSYHAFCSLIIEGLEEAIKQVYREELTAPDPAPQAAEVQQQAEQWQPAQQQPQAQPQGLQSQTAQSAPSVQQAFSGETGAAGVAGGEPSARNQSPETAAAKFALISSITVLAGVETEFIKGSSKIPEEDKSGGILILTELVNAVRGENASLIEALVCGYNCFAFYYDSFSGGLESLFDQIAAYVKML